MSAREQTSLTVQDSLDDAAPSGSGGDEYKYSRISASSGLETGLYLLQVRPR